MRFGSREIADVVLRAKSKITLGNKTFYKNEPVLYFDTLKTSSLEGAATTVYATGGRGNARLIAWEGERTLTFTMEDALLSMESFSILTGAGLIDASAAKPIYVHQTSQIEVLADNTIVIPDGNVCWNKETNTAYKHNGADIFVMVLNDNGEVAAEPCIPASIGARTNDSTTITCYSHDGVLLAGSIVLVDYYVKRTSGAQMFEITADKFGGFYYLEASTLFRREADGVDMPAEFIIPRCKVQSNFTFSMAATGDPSTFTFTLDAFPDYTKFDKTKKVLAAIQVIEDEFGEEEEHREPCVSNPKTTVSVNSTGVTVVPDVSGATQSVTINGTDVTSGYDTDTFPITQTGTEIVINLPVDGAATYKVVQTNPGLEYFFDEGDPTVAKSGENYVKAKEYDIPDNAVFDYHFLVTDKGGPIKIEFYKGSVLVKTYNINANVSFAA